jgi:hypothetical protein
MKNHIIALALVAAMSVVPACKKKPEQEITVQFSLGNARIITAAGEKAVAPGDVLSFDDRIVTGPSSAVDLNFGTKGVIRISENSSVTLTALKDDSEGEQTQFYMKKGKIFVIVSKLAKGSNFTVATQTTLAAIRGTSFMVVSDPKTSKISVLKGKILVQLAREGKLAENIEKMLEANKKVVVSEDLANQIIAGKKKLEVAPLTPKEIAEIKKEMKEIRISDNLDPEVQSELKELSKETPDTIKNKTLGSPKEIPTIPSI